MLAGTLLCNAGMHEDKSVTFFPAYGAEIRGGTANCQVIISDNSIGSPIVYAPDILISLNKPSFDKFHKKVKPGGLIIANSSLYKPTAQDGISLEEVPVNNLAEECGSLLVANIVMLGALVAKTKILELKSILNAIPEVLTEKKTASLGAE